MDKVESLVVKALLPGFKHRYVQYLQLYQEKCNQGYVS